MNIEKLSKIKIESWVKKHIEICEKNLVKSFIKEKIDDSDKQKNIIASAVAESAILVLDSILIEINSGAFDFEY